MKRRVLILGIAVVLILIMLPAVALAYSSGSETYNDHDYNAMVSFLNQPSAVSGQTNVKTGGSGLICVLIWMGVPIIAAIIVRILLQKWRKDEGDEEPGFAAALVRRLIRKRKDDDD